MEIWPCKKRIILIAHYSIIYCCWNRTPHDVVQGIFLKIMKRPQENSLREILTRCKLIGAWICETGCCCCCCVGGGAKDGLPLVIRSWLRARSISSSTSLPLVSPRSYHSTVTDRCAGFSFETIAECTRPEMKKL